MFISIQEKKAEAVRRMREVGIASVIIDDFEKNGNVQLFETPLGAGYWLNDEEKKIVEKFEREHDGLVYSGTRNRMVCDGDIYDVMTLLYVSDHKDEWDDDRNDLCCGFPFAYVYNKTCPVFSEIGCVGIRRTVAGGLRRTS